MKRAPNWSHGETYWQRKNILDKGIAKTKGHQEERRAKLHADRYWGAKNITWYSFRRTGISFAVSRGVPTLQLSRNAGTGSRYIEDVYYHHESESKKTWDTLMQNRVFYDNMKKHQSELLVEIEDIMDGIDESEIE